MTSPSDPTPDIRTEEGYQGSAMAALENQTEAAWNLMLSQATAAGFTREQIISLTLSTAAAILDASYKALWSGEATPEGEAYARYAYAALRDDLRNDAANWQTREVETGRPPME